MKEKQKKQNARRSALRFPDAFCTFFSAALRFLSPSHIRLTFKGLFFFLFVVFGDSPEDG